MATATVSASVDVEVKRLAGAYIRQAGSTPNEVIRNLWVHIAQTGEVPTFESAPAPEAAGAEEPTAFAELMRLRAQVPAGTALSSMSPADLKRELEDRDL